MYVAPIPDSVSSNWSVFPFNATDHENHENVKWHLVGWGSAVTNKVSQRKK